MEQKAYTCVIRDAKPRTLQPHHASLSFPAVVPLMAVVLLLLILTDILHLLLSALQLAVVSLVVVVLFLFIWWWYARKALIDHRSLPYSRYK